MILHLCDALSLREIVATTVISDGAGTHSENVNLLGTSARIVPTCNEVFSISHQKRDANKTTPRNGDDNCTHETYTHQYRNCVCMYRTSTSEKFPHGRAQRKADNLAGGCGGSAAAGGVTYSWR